MKNASGSIMVTPLETPVGSMILGSFENGICLCDWMANVHRTRIDRHVQQSLNASFQEGRSDMTERLKNEIRDYLERGRTRFDIPLILTGTPFQNRVWNMLLRIPYGSTLSYGELSLLLGMPKAVRAIAHAVAANPLAILVPCHRVIGSNGQLAGYTGGTHAKRRLIEMEAEYAKKNQESDLILREDTLSA